MWQSESTEANMYKGQGQNPLSHGHKELFLQLQNAPYDAHNVKVKITQCALHTEHSWPSDG